MQASKHFFFYKTKPKKILVTKVYKNVRVSNVAPYGREVNILLYFLWDTNYVEPLFLCGLDGSLFKPREIRKRRKDDAYFIRAPARQKNWRIGAHLSIGEH